jgi:uncharacterized protein (DUF3084 family)
VNSLLVAVASVVGGLGGLAGLATLVTAFARRRTITAEAEVRLSDEARQWVEQFQEDARSARTEARDARTEAHAARQEAIEAHAQMRVVRAEAEWLAAQLQALRRAITDPQVTIERLRVMIGPDPPPNGTGQ